jgi:hypothetical protein
VGKELRFLLATSIGPGNSFRSHLAVDVLDSLRQATAKLGSPDFQHSFG